MMPNLAFAGQLVPLRKISEAAKTMDGNVTAINDAIQGYNKKWVGVELRCRCKFRKGGTK